MSDKALFSVGKVGLRGIDIRIDQQTINDQIAQNLPLRVTGDSEGLGKYLGQSSAEVKTAHASLKENRMIEITGTVSVQVFSTQPFLLQFEAQTEVEFNSISNSFFLKEPDITSVKEIKREQESLVIIEAGTSAEPLVKPTWLVQGMQWVKETVVSEENLVEIGRRAVNYFLKSYVQKNPVYTLENRGVDKILRWNLTEIKVYNEYVVAHLNPLKKIGFTVFRFLFVGGSVALGSYLAFFTHIIFK